MFIEGIEIGDVNAAGLEQTDVFRLRFAQSHHHVGAAQQGDTVFLNHGTLFSVIAVRDASGSPGTGFNNNLSTKTDQFLYSFGGRRSAMLTGVSFF